MSVVHNLLTRETRTIFRLIAEYGYEARIVGGAVRDVLMGEAPADIDFATTMPAHEIVGCFRGAGYYVVDDAIDYGTLRVIIGAKAYEITTLRSDVGTFGRQAQVEFTSDWLRDAKRRDFTINALYIDEKGTLYDYFNGVQDVACKRVRFIGDARQRVQEDYLRILRYFRFCARYARSPLMYHDVFDDSVDGFAIISKERITSELLRFCTYPASASIIDSYAGFFKKALGIRKNFLRLYYDDVRHPLIPREIEPQHLLWLLFSESSECMSGARITLSRQIKRLQQYLDWTGKSTRLNMLKCEREERQLIALHRLFVTGDIAEYDALQEFVSRICEFSVTGSDLRDILRPEQFRSVMPRLREFWLSTNGTASKDALIALAKTLAHDA